jgi:hypothetical protein
MKKLIVLSIFLLPYLAFAQFSKGQVYLGGTASTSFQNSGPTPSPGISKNNFISMSPVFGYFVNPKLVLGVSVGYSSQFYETDYANYNSNTNSYLKAFQKSKYNWVFITPLARYYVPISNSFYFAAQGQINFTRGNSTTTVNDGTNETTNEAPYYSLGLTFKPVLIFFPDPKWGIEASVGSLGYTYTKYLPDVYSTTTFSLSAGSFSFGLAYYFVKK